MNATGRPPVDADERPTHPMLASVVLVTVVVALIVAISVASAYG